MIRREYLDRLIFWNASDLERKLQVFAQYYNQHRVHQSLAGKTPVTASGDIQSQSAKLDQYSWQPHCNGLYQAQVAA